MKVYIIIIGEPFVQNLSDTWVQLWNVVVLSCVSGQSTIFYGILCSLDHWTVNLHHDTRMNNVPRKHT